MIKKYKPKRTSWAYIRFIKNKKDIYEKGANLMFIQHLTNPDKIMLIVFIYVFLGATSNLFINIDMFQMSDGIFPRISTKFTIINFLFFGIGLFYYLAQRKNLVRSTNDLLYIIENIEHDDKIDDNFANKYICYKKNNQKFKNLLLLSYLKEAYSKILSSDNVSKKLKDNVKSLG